MAISSQNAGFRWNKHGMIKLIKCLAAYKAKCTYEGKYFNAVKVAQSRLKVAQSKFLWRFRVKMQVSDGTNMA